MIIMKKSLIKIKIKDFLKDYDLSKIKSSDDLEKDEKKFEIESYLKTIYVNGKNEFKKKFIMMVFHMLIKNLLV